MSRADKQWAYLSVQDYTGLVDFAKGLQSKGMELVATPGTMAFLNSNNIEVHAVEELTNFPLILGGIVKSIHPVILAGIQVDRRNQEMLAECRERNIPVFAVVAINFAGSEKVNGKLNQDIPLQVAPITLIRAAAANYSQVLIATEPRNYSSILAHLDGPGENSQQFRKSLALQAWNIACHYDLLAASAFDNVEDEILPQLFRSEYRMTRHLSYGENPHQQAALYAKPHWTTPNVAGARQIHGRALSFNNIIDADNGLALALEFAAPGVVIIKHALPVSAAVGKSISEAISRACDSNCSSKIGAAIACNNIVDAEAAGVLLDLDRGDEQCKIDLIIAPDFTNEAIKYFKNKDDVCGGLQLLKTGPSKHPAGTGRSRKVALHHVSGGIVAQTVDDGVYGSGGFHVVSKRIPTDEELIDLEFACLVAKHTRSQATVLARNGATIAVASVATERIEAARIVLRRSQGKSEGSVMASDGNIFVAELELMAEIGVQAFIHSGSDIKEEEKLIEICERHNLALIVTRMRHFRHV